MGQRLKKLVIIPLMESDAGLVQDIGHSHQAGAYLGGQADALGLSAGQGACGPGQGKIIQSHVNKKAYPGPDFLQNRGAYGLLHGSQLQPVHEFLKPDNGHVGGFIYIHPAHRNCKGLLFKPLPLTDRAGCNPHIGLIFRLGRFGKSLLVAAVYILNQALKRHVIDALASLTLIADLHLPASGSV